MPGPFTVILADPPWHYRDKAAAGERGAAFKYPCMTRAEIAALPVAELAADDAALFLWVTPPMLPDGLDVLTRWGFTFKTIAFTWVKLAQNGKPAWGMGNFTRANAEHVLLGVRGKPARVSAAVHSLISSPRREHSRKPDEVRDRIVTLFGDVPRVELFARGTLPAGWAGWGDEYTGTDEAAE